MDEKACACDLRKYGSDFEKRFLLVLAEKRGYDGDSEDRQYGANNESRSYVTNEESRNHGSDDESRIYGANDGSRPMVPSRRVAATAGIMTSAARVQIESVVRSYEGLWRLPTRRN